MGKRQLALIARALARQARIVVLDEPTVSLDFGYQGKVMREIRRLCADGLGRYSWQLLPASGAW